jgi:hypothetical protein
MDLEGFKGKALWLIQEEGGPEVPLLVARRQLLVQEHITQSNRFFPTKKKSQK